MGLKRKKVKKQITNANCKSFMDGSRIEVHNIDYFAEPFEKHDYTFDLRNMSNNVYISGVHHVRGVFENMTFNDNTFFDKSEFNKTVFRNCHFNNISIRWCTFKGCQFINCTGEIRRVHGVTFKKDCTYSESYITIKEIDQYMFINGRRYASDWVGSHGNRHFVALLRSKP